MAFKDLSDRKWVPAPHHWSLKLVALLGSFSTGYAFKLQGKPAYEFWHGFLISLSILCVAYLVQEYWRIYSANRWPEREERANCAELWSSEKTSRIHAALKSDNPSGILRTVYAALTTDRLANEFRSAVIAR